MSNKIVGWVGIVVGALLIVLSLIADFIGIGSYPGINYAQLIGAGVGLVVMVLGFLVTRKKQKVQE